MILSLVLSILFSVFFSLPQDEILFEKELNYKTEYIAVDKLGYLYLADGSLLRKLDLETNQLRNFSNAQLGMIHSVDVSDPFRILVFYKDFNKVEWLDKSLSSIISPVSLDELGYYQIAAICQSVNGGFWLFDQSLNQLVFIDKNLKAGNKSVHLTELFDQNTELSDVYMLEKNDYIYLGINGNNIMLFDTYGTYIKTFPIKYNREFEVNNGIISYHNNKELFFYNTKKYTEAKIELNLEEALQVKISNNRIFIRTGTKILIYQANNI